MTFFNRQPLEKQPQAIVEVNLRLRALLEEVLPTIPSLTVRGQQLVHMPVRLVGVDGNQQALEKKQGRQLVFDVLAFHQASWY